MPSAWEVDLGTARFTLTLSPERYRGFSGEGALLGCLADPSVSGDADLVSVLLDWDPLIDIGRLAAEADFSAERTVAALTHLAATGRVADDPGLSVCAVAVTSTGRGPVCHAPIVPGRSRARMVRNLSRRCFTRRRVVAGKCQ